MKKNHTPQARPNVLFETGMAVLKNENRTIIVEIGNLRPFSDISGIHVVKFDGTPEKRHELISKLQLAGCNINNSGSDWLRVGDFSIVK